MRSFLLAVLSLSLGGCYADYVEPGPYYGGGGYVSAEIPVGPPAPISVAMAPPPLRYEPMLSCGYNQTYIRGGWHWRGGWSWAPGRCVGVISGYTYVPPSYSGGVYIAGHWAGGGGYYRPGPAYVPPPAPAYRPAPVYAPRPVYVAPRPAYVPPPAPAYRPAPAPVYVAPRPAYVAPRPAYVPPPAPAYRPAPAPAYRPAVPPPAPAYRPAPAPAYRPPARSVSVPPPAPAYR